LPQARLGILRAVGDLEQEALGRIADFPRCDDGPQRTLFLKRGGSQELIRIVEDERNMAARADGKRLVRVDVDQIVGGAERSMPSARRPSQP
jgi:hypothetical protein